MIDLRAIHRIEVTNWATLYLISPVILFWCCYIDGISGWMIGLFLLAGTIVLLRWQLREKSKPIAGHVLWTGRCSAAVAATFVIATMGFFIHTYAWDWHKHWALMGLLVDEPWPVHTTLNGEPLYLRFYIAAYIVPAAISAKLHIPLFWAAGTWFWLGCYFCFRLLTIPLPSDKSQNQRLMALIAMVTPFLFLFSGGADTLITAFFHNPLPFGLHSEWWAAQFLGFNWQYSSPLAALTWVPHQAIATLITVALLIRKNSLPGFLIAYAALSMWSPLAMIGLLPLLLVQLVQHRVELVYPYWRSILISGLLMIVPVLAAVRFLTSELPDTGFGSDSVSNIVHRLGYVLFFIACELVLVWGCLGRKAWQDPLLRTSLFVVLAIPLLSAGNPPDFVMRASMGPLGLLLYTAIAELPKQLVEGSWSRKIIVLASFLIVLPTTLNESAFHLQAGKAYNYLSREDPIANHDIYYNFATKSDISVSEFFDACGWKYLPQYFAKSPAFITSD